MTNPFIYDTSKPTNFVSPRTTPNNLQYEMDCLVAQLRWKHALVDCQVAGRDYTEIHFWRNPETEELVLTYWEIPQ
jgi:hypothetical protein